MFRGFFVAALLVAFAAPIVAAVVYVAGREDPARASTRVEQPPATPASSFAGRTSQQREISFDLAVGGRTIRELHVTYKADCGETLAFELDDKFYTPVAVAPDGTFSVQGVGKRLTFSGHVADGQATGRVRVDYEYGGFLKCTTPDLHWRAAKI
jgi:hypothetical protein